MIRIVIVVCAVAALAGCAGTAADRDFRSKVESISAGTEASYDGKTYRGGVSGRIYFRDPMVGDAR